MRTIVYAAAVYAACIGCAESFAPLPLVSSRRTAPTRATTLRMMSNKSEDLQRRQFLQVGVFAGISGAVSVAPAAAKRARSDVKTFVDPDGNIETPEERKERIKKERAAVDEVRKAADSKAKEYEAVNGVAETEMGSNLRGDYYYPTARKRYLPRVRKAYEELVKVKEAPGLGKWEQLERFAKGPGDVGSALKLYASALAGGGLSISGNFIEKMKSAANDYDANAKNLIEAVKSKDADKTSSLLETMQTSLLAYREAGKPVGLTGDDWGVGAVPNCVRGKGTGKMSECSVGASFGNNNPNLYSRNLNAIDDTD